MVETVSVGRMTLHENFPAALSTDAAGKFTLTGIEYADTLTADDTRRRAEDIRGLAGAFVPVVFSDRPEAALYCRVNTATVDVTRYEAVANVLTWTLDMARFGTNAELDIESRLSGPVTRVTDHALTGERWHAPALNHYSYWSSSTLPAIVTRTGADGAITVYRNVPALVSPRWGCTPANYTGARVRFTDAASERTGVGFTADSTAWELSNGLVRVTPEAATGGLRVESYTGGGWRLKRWALSATATVFPLASSVTVLRNDMHEVCVRLLYAMALGRFTVDLTLRRGSRFVELYVQGQTSSTLKVALNTSEASTAGTGFVRATANDADGNQAIVGSARTFTADTTVGGLSKAATVTLDAFVGVIAGGSAAVSGDQAADLVKQYLGTPGELVAPIRR